jgi:hypothetical protein
MDVDTERRQRPTHSERFEKSFAGEVLISALVTAALTIGVVFNLPDSAIKNSAMPALDPLATSSGADQIWRMYAPDPIQRTEVLEIHVTMADGGDRVWSFNKGGRTSLPTAMSAVLD